MAETSYDLIVTGAGTGGHHHGRPDCPKGSPFDHGRAPEGRPSGFGSLFWGNAPSRIRGSRAEAYVYQCPVGFSGPLSDPAGNSSRRLTPRPAGAG